MLKPLQRRAVWSFLHDQEPTNTGTLEIQKVAFAVKLCCIIKVYDNRFFCFCGYNKSRFKMWSELRKQFSFCQDYKFCYLISGSVPSCSQRETTLYLTVCGNTSRAVSCIYIFLYLRCLLQKHHSIHFITKLSNIFPLCSLRQGLEKKAPYCAMHSGDAISAVSQLHSSHVANDTQMMPSNISLYPGSLFLTPAKILGTERAWLREGRRNNMGFPVSFSVTMKISSEITTFMVKKHFYCPKMWFLHVFFFIFKAEQNSCMLWSFVSPGRFQRG